MMVKIQGYNYRIISCPGSDMIFFGTLSQLPNPENNNTIKLDERLDGMCHVISLGDDRSRINTILPSEWTVANR